MFGSPIDIIGSGNVSLWVIDGGRGEKRGSKSPVADFPFEVRSTKGISTDLLCQYYKAMSVCYVEEDIPFVGLRFRCDQPSSCA